MRIGSIAVGVIWVALTWQRHEVLKLTAQRTALETNIAAMTDTQAALAKKGAQFKTATFSGRLCIASSADQGQSTVDWRWAWHTGDGVPLVIPKRY